MLILIYRKTDALPLLKIGAATSNQLKEIHSLATVLSTERPKTAVAKQESELITYQVTDKFIYIIQDTKEQEKIVQLIEESFSIEFNLKVNSVSSQYEFENYEDTLNEIVSKAQSESELQLLNEETQEVKQIVHENLESILQRGANLNKMETDSVQLLDGTKDLLKNAKELDLRAFWRRYSVYIVIAAIILIYLLIKIL